MGCQVPEVDLEYLTVKPDGYGKIVCDYVRADADRLD
jgi:hypothetical protein